MDVNIQPVFANMSDFDSLGVKNIGVKYVDVKKNVDVENIGQNVENVDVENIGQNVGVKNLGVENIASKI